MKSVIVSAKTLEKAIEEGLAQLDAKFEQVDINVLSDGGFLKKFKVEIVLSEDTEKEKPKQPDSLEKPKTQPVVKEKPAPKAQPNKAQAEKPAKPEVAEVKQPKPESEEDTKLQQELQNIEQELKQYEQPSVDDEQKQELLKLAHQEIDKFLNGLLYAYGIIAKVETIHEDRIFKTSILGDNLGVLIGYRGEALQAIQFILSNHIFNKIGRNFKIVLDIENYRSRRAETLEGMADNLAKKVVENKRSLKLEPMSSYERKVIHTRLQDKPNIATHSEGQEPNRYLVIEYVD